MARAAREVRRAGEAPDTRRCMGTLVLDDLADDPRVVGPRAEASGDSGRSREDVGQPSPPATDPRDHQHADREHARRRVR